jgi:hypothetical protein
MQILACLLLLDQCLWSATRLSLSEVYRILLSRVHACAMIITRLFKWQHNQQAAPSWRSWWDHDDRYLHPSTKHSCTRWKWSFVDGETKLCYLSEMQLVSTWRLERERERPVKWNWTLQPSSQKSKLNFCFL